MYRNDGLYYRHLNCAFELYKELTGNERSNHTMHELAENIAEASDIIRVLLSRNMVETTIEKNANGKIWRPILVVSVDGGPGYGSI